MGRQAHLTRLALGRSPFGDPLRDENGDFILGANAHINDGPGYRQQFDNRGHPQNRVSRSTARRLRRAQNDVLATVGVVIRKDEERKSKWERLKDTQKLNIVSDENKQGGQLQVENRLIGGIASWPVVSLRNRIMTMYPYHVPSLVSLLRKEISVIGLSRFVLGGLPAFLLSSLPRSFRWYFSSPGVENMVNFASSYFKKPRRRSSDPRWWYLSLTFAWCLEFPIVVHATLQSLQLVSSRSGPGWLFFVPFSSSSPIALPVLPRVVTNQGIAHFFADILLAPFFLHLVRDCLEVQLGYRVYALLRQLLLKPDRPDAISAKVSDEAENPDDISMAGIVIPGTTRGGKTERRFGPRSFTGALRVAFPSLYYLLDYFSGGRLAISRGRLSVQLDRQLRTAVRERYWDERIDTVPLPRRGSPEDIDLRYHIVDSVFRSMNLDPVEELVDWAAWTNDTLGPNEAKSTEMVSIFIDEALRAVPDSDAVIIQASDGRLYISDQLPLDTTNVAGRDNIRTIIADEVSLTAVMEGMREAAPEAEEVQLTDVPAHEDEMATGQEQQLSLSTPATPTPGILRARSLTGHGDTSIIRSGPRPVRRPTETDDSLAAISETLRAEAQALPSPRPSPPGSSPASARQPQSLYQTMDGETDASTTVLPPIKRRLYRVTMLSNYVADSLAWHASAVLSSLILWPFEALWLRSVASWALQNPALGQTIDPWWAARLGFGIVGRPVAVLGSGTWFGGARAIAGKWRYTESIIMTFGLECFVRYVCWMTTSWQVKRIKDRYGWGQF